MRDGDSQGTLKENGHGSLYLDSRESKFGLQGPVNFSFDEIGYCKLIGSDCPEDGMTWQPAELHGGNPDA